MKIFLDVAYLNVIFLKRNNFIVDVPKKENKKENDNKEKEKKNKPVVFTHIKSNPVTTTKTNILDNCNNDLK
jgi:hypothetical protein